jgi:hypothetical protein
LVIDKWGGENGVKYLSSVMSTLITDSQMRVLITLMQDQLESNGKTNGKVRGTNRG